MMKQLSILLCIILFNGAMQPLCQAAVTDWVKTKAHQAQQAAQEKLVQAQQTISQLQQTLQSNAQCLMYGACQAGQKEKIWSLAKKVGITIAALLAIAAAAGIAAKVGLLEDQAEPQLAISSPEIKKQVSAIEIVQQYGVDMPIDIHGNPDIERSTIGPLLQGINVNALGDIRRLSDRLTLKELAAGIAYANKLGHTIIEDLLKKIKNIFELLVNKAESGVLRVVQEVYCKFDPTSKAREVSLQKAQNKMSSNPGVFGPIVKFLETPQCSAKGG